MDPEQTIADLMYAATNRDIDGVKEAADNLVSWLEHGGYVPEIQLAGKEREIEWQLTLGEFGELMQDLVESRQTEWYKVVADDGDDFDIKLKIV